MPSHWIPVCTGMVNRVREIERDLVLPYDKKLRERSQQLRKDMTAAETFLWSKIRMKQVKGCWFYRQKTIGEYIADFYCPSAKLVVEVDGGQHFNDEVAEYDKIRNEYMAGLGLRVLRFTNIDVLTNIDGVIHVIEKNILG
jgi:very-short-patch-repair endonuclease